MHGLLGSSRNWRSVAKGLGDHFQMHCLDLRNHGDSFHEDDSSIQAMSDDLLRYADHQNITKMRSKRQSNGIKTIDKIMSNFVKRKMEKEILINKAISRLNIDKI